MASGLGTLKMLTLHGRTVDRFLPRDATHKRGLCRHAVSVRPSVYLSVCVSVTFVDHVKTNKHNFESFSPSGSHTILVFPNQTGWRYSDGTPPLTGASNAGGVGKIAILSLYLALVPAVSAATSQVLSTESPVKHGQRTASCDTSLVVSGGVLRDKTTKCL